MVLFGGIDLLSVKAFGKVHYSYQDLIYPFVKKRYSYWDLIHPFGKVYYNYQDLIHPFSHRLTFFALSLAKGFSSIIQ